MVYRGGRFVCKAAFYGLTSALLLSTSTLVATAADSPDAQVAAPTNAATTVATSAPIGPSGESLPAGIIISGNTITMAPIPDRVPAHRGHTFAPAPAAPLEPATIAAAPAVGALTAASVTVATISTPDSRPALIIKDGVVTMAPVEDHVRAAPAFAVSDARPHGEANCLARAIYFEARGESVRGQEAVAQVVLARVRSPDRPKTICGVVYEGSNLSTGCQFSFTCDGIPDLINDRGAWARAQRIASLAMLRKLKPVARGATYYHANYVRPSWASHMIRVATIGTHIFYRP
jgi:hypothetical protein